MTDKEINKFLAKYSVEKTTKVTFRVGALAWFVMWVAGATVPVWLMWVVLTSFFMRIAMLISMMMQYTSMNRRFLRNFMAAGTTA